jgi:spore cortex formation protein SpoVR/YcgB (stage V sporulation)
MATMAKYYRESIQEPLKPEYRGFNINKKSDSVKSGSNPRFNEQYYKELRGWEITKSREIIEDKNDVNPIMKHLLIYDFTTKFVLFVMRLLGSAITNVHKSIRKPESKSGNLQLNKLEEVKSAIKTK